MTIDEAKRRLPLPMLMHQVGLGAHAKKRAFCPFHDDQHPSFSVYRDNKGELRFKCFAGCSEGDEITFLEKCKGISNKDATKLFLEMASEKGPASAKPFVAARTVEEGKEMKVTGGPTATPKAFDWQSCIAAFTKKDALRFALWRGYSVKVFTWLKENKLAGLYDGSIAFPVHDRVGKFVACHYRLKDAPGSIIRLAQRRVRLSLAS